MGDLRDKKETLLGVVESEDIDTARLMNLITSMPDFAEISSKHATQGNTDERDTDEKGRFRYDIGDSSEVNLTLDDLKASTSVEGTSVEESPVERIEKALKNLKQIDYDMVEMFGSASKLRKTERQLRDLRSILLQASDEALHESMAEDSERWMPTWEMIIESRDSGKEYVVSWEIGSKWRDGERVPDFGCTCPSFKYKQGGEYCKHIKRVRSEHSSNGEMPPMAKKTGECAVLHRKGSA